MPTRDGSKKIAVARLRPALSGRYIPHPSFSIRPLSVLDGQTQAPAPVVHAQGCAANLRRQPGGQAKLSSVTPQTQRAIDQRLPARAQRRHVNALAAGVAQFVGQIEAQRALKVAPPHLLKPQPEGQQRVDAKAQRAVVHGQGFVAVPIRHAFPPSLKSSGNIVISCTRSAMLERTVALHAVKAYALVQRLAPARARPAWAPAGQTSSSWRYRCLCGS